MLQGDTCEAQRCLHRIQAQVTELVLQRFQSAELGDLPALLRFLLQHVNPQNASQVTAAVCITLSSPNLPPVQVQLPHPWGTAALTCCSK